MKSAILMGFLLAVSVLCHAQDLDQRLVDAISAGNSIKAVDLLESGVSPIGLYSENHNLTALGLVILEARTDAFAQLLAQALFEHGYRLMPQDDLVLQLAIDGDFLELIRLLIGKGLDPNRVVYGKSLMYMAQAANKERIIDLLASLGAQTAIPKTKLSQVHLVFGSAKGDLSMVRAALASGALINAKTDEGQTALVQAIIGGTIIDTRRLALIRFLLEEGANPNVQAETDTQGVYGTPLHVIMYAAWISYISTRQTQLQENVIAVIRMLISHEAMISSRDKTDRTPLHLAAKYNLIDIARLLLENGSKLNARDSRGWTPLDYAESAEMIAFLKASGATE